jgi:hypothetical protein
MISRVALTLGILAAMIVGLNRWSQSSTAQQVFTGNAAKDFTSSSAIRIADDPEDPDVGMPRQLPFENSGWDVRAVYMDYSPVSDTLSIGIECWAICGDADGDGYEECQICGLLRNQTEE